MSNRLNPYAVAPEIFPALKALQEVVNASGLEPALRELVATRASQINGCAFCLDFHFQRAITSGEKPERLLLLSAWREATCYTATERAALAWCEAVTQLAGRPVSDEAYREARSAFSEAELARLTLAVVVINGWNRINAPFAVPPGALG